MVKKICLFFILWMTGFSVMAKPISGLVFFGDSLTDNGNIYRLLLNILPKSPPYYQGRFSNGPTWADNLGKYYYDKYNIDYQVYAYGGATAIFHVPSLKFIAPTNLQLELYLYYLNTLFTDKSDILYSVWIGGNDYLFDNEDDLETLTTQVVDSTAWGLDFLIQQGAKNLLVLNLPDLARTPFAQENGEIERLHAATIIHNEKLIAAVNDIRIKNPDVSITYIDVYKIMADVIENPEKYNEKYTIDIQNTSDACWGGGMFLKKFAANANSMLMTDIQRAIAKKNQKLSHHKAIDPELVSRYVQNSSELSATYMLGKLYEQGVMPCANADQYLFWDFIHPSAIVHQVLTEIIKENLGSKYNA